VKSQSFLRAAPPTLVSDAPQPSVEITPVLVCVGVVCLLAFVAGLWVGNKGVIGGAAGVAIATEVARRRIRKTKDEVSSLRSSVSDAIKASIEKEAEANAASSSEEVEAEARSNLDTGDSTWGRTSIFPDD
jgi:hypothetical protein